MCGNVHKEERMITESWVQVAVIITANLLVLLWATIQAKKG